MKNNFVPESGEGGGHTAYYMVRMPDALEVSKFNQKTTVRNRVEIKSQHW